MKILIAYIPVLHRGYVNFFKKYGEGGLLLLPDQKTLALVEYLERDVRALSQKDMSLAIDSLFIFERVRVVGINDIIEYALRNSPSTLEFVMPDEDISHRIAGLLPKETSVSFDSVFLRWDMTSVIRKQERFWDREMEMTDFFESVISKALKEKEKAGDWWRQIGTVVWRDNEIILTAHNRHLPDEQELNYSGDPRTCFQAGQFIEYSSAIHGEAALIAEAAKRGIALLGSEMYVTTFPCVPCANLISQCGIKTLYISDGYSNLGAKEIFAREGIEIIKINKPLSF